MTTDADNDLTLDEQNEAIDILGKIDFATEIAEKAGTSVVVSADQMRLALRYVEHVVGEFNEAYTQLQLAPRAALSEGEAK